MSTTHHLGQQKHQMLHIMVMSLFPSLSQGWRWCICRYSLVINLLLVYMQPSSIGFGCEVYNIGVCSHACWKRDPVELIAAVSNVEFQCVPWYYWCLFSESLLLSERNEYSQIANCMSHLHEQWRRGSTFWIYKQEPRLNFPRGEVSWWILDYINYYPLQSITEEFASSDFQLRAIMKQYKHDLSGHNLALRIQKYMYILSFSAFLGITGVYFLNL